MSALNSVDDPLLASVSSASSSKAQLPVELARTGAREVSFEAPGSPPDLCLLCFDHNFLVHRGLLAVWSEVVKDRIPQAAEMITVLSSGEHLEAVSVSDYTTPHSLHNLLLWIYQASLEARVLAPRPGSKTLVTPGLQVPDSPDPFAKESLRSTLRTSRGLGMPRVLEAAQAAVAKASITLLPLDATHRSIHTCLP